MMTRPEFGIDLMMKIMANNQVYMSSQANGFTCSYCKEGAIWIDKPGREPPDTCPFCGRRTVCQRGKDVIFTSGQWSNALTVSTKRRRLAASLDG
jgi:hypothetical protein